MLKFLEESILYRSIDQNKLNSLLKTDEQTIKELNIDQKTKNILIILAKAGKQKLLIHQNYEKTLKNVIGICNWIGLKYDLTKKQVFVLTDKKIIAALNNHKPDLKQL